MKTQMMSLLALTILASTGIAPAALASDIPRPADVEVSRDNYQRTVNILHDAGLNRQEIKRWIHASINAHNGPDWSNIPNPKRIKITRRNYKRIVKALHGLGLNRKQIKRWINISVNSHYPDHDGPIVKPGRIDKVVDKVSDVRVDTRRAIREDSRRDRRVDRAQPETRRADRLVRQVRPIRVDRAPQPARLVRPVRSRG